LTSWQQSPDEVLLIRPASFGYNEQTSTTNHFQHRDSTLIVSDVYSEALKELDALAENYRRAGITVHVRQNNDPLAPDAIFPNSIVTFDPGAFCEKRSVTLHPMREENRRRERSPEFVRYLEAEHGYEVVKDLTAHENEGRPLEGTGSLVLDRRNRIVYCTLSGRSDITVAKEFAEFTGMELVAFDTADENGRSIYHTDVLMHIGSDFAGICSEVILDKDRDRVLSSLKKTHDVIEFSYAQLKQFCGNALELRSKSGKRFLSCSERAFQAYTPTQINRYLEHVSEIIHTPVTVVEDIGGGSVRCMTQELF